MLSYTETASCTPKTPDWLAVVMAFVLAAAVSSPSAAQSERRQPGNEALMRAQSLLQQLSTEKDALAAKNQKLEQEKAALDKQLKDAQARLKRYHLANSGLKSRLNRNMESAQKDRENLENTIARYKDALQKSQDQGVRLANQVADQSQQIDECEHKNLILYKTDVALLQKYNDKGVFAALLQHEPFTGIKKVEVENVLQEYRNKLADNRFKKKSEAVKAVGDSTVSSAP